MCHVLPRGTSTFDISGQKGGPANATMIDTDRLECLRQNGDRPHGVRRKIGQDLHTGERFGVPNRVLLGRRFAGEAIRIA
jgi:hypothetical protein